jgi:hypothetical protein
MSFKITIEETTIEEVIGGKEWKTLETTKDGGNIRGYSPEIVKTVEIERVVYTQIISELNLVSVINAVNGYGK